MHDEDHHNGLLHDLRVMGAGLNRRQILRLLAGASLLPLVAACGSGRDDTAGNADDEVAGDGDSSGDGSCSTIPQETAGPYPGDGTNGANALVLAGILRSDIRASIAGASGTAAGIPLTIKLTLVNSAGSCEPLAGYAVYLWHCDRDGNYSMYSSAVATQNYLRGVQESDDEGNVTFTSIFPACYSGRWPHIHFEIYASVAAATNGANKLHVSQLAMPETACNDVFATTGYSASVSNLSKITLATDNVFSDGSSQQLATVTGNTSAGYVATLTVGVPV